MKNKVTIPTVLFLLVLAFSFYAFSKEKSKGQLLDVEIAQRESQIILFYGIGCPHCAVVDDYVSKNSIRDKIYFVEKESFLNRNNAKELEEKAQACDLPTDSIGVPFLWDGEKCLIGDEDIINFFKQKINTQ